MAITGKFDRDNAGEILIEFIIQKGVMQSTVAKKTGLTENTISSLINGGKPQGITVQKLKKYLKSIGYYVEEK